MTEVLLAENEILKKRLEHIKDLCEEVRCLEDVDAMCREIDKIKDICDGNVCSNCKWWQKEDISDGMVCVNGESYDCTCWTDANYTCPYCEKKMLSRVNRIKWVQTCVACPEQYDLYDADTERLIAYVRERHGDLTVQCPDVDGEYVFEAELDEDASSVMFFQEPIEQAVKDYWENKSLN